MKKHILLFLIALSSLSFLFSEDIKPEGMKESVRLSVTTTNTVYLGVSSQKVVSSIFPSSSIIDEEKFYYNPKEMLWYSPSLFFFVISFVDLPLDISLSIPVSLAPLTTGVSTSLSWKPSGDINITVNGKGFVSGDQNVQTINLITESDKDIGKPRVYCWEVKMAIPGETVIEGQYSGKYTLTITSVS